MKKRIICAVLLIISLFGCIEKSYSRPENLLDNTAVSSFSSDSIEYIISSSDKGAIQNNDEDDTVIKLTPDYLINDKSYVCTSIELGERPQTGEYQAYTVKQQEDIICILNLIKQAQQVELTRRPNGGLPISAIFSIENATIELWFYEADEHFIWKSEKVQYQYSLPDGSWKKLSEFIKQNTVS